MSITKSIRLVDHYADDYNRSNILYITLSKTLNKKLKDSGIESIYLFDVDNPDNLKDILQKIERGLSEETISDPTKRWFKVSYKFIYRYLLTYNQFYNRFETIIQNNKAVGNFQVSKNTTKIIKDILKILCKKYNIILEYNSESFVGFSDYSSFMPVDLPKISNTDTHNIFIYVIALFYRFTKHDTFMLPCPLDGKLPQNVNFLRVSFFSIFQKIKKLLLGNNNKKYLSNFSYIDFDSNYKKKYKLNIQYWNSFRDDQIKFIEKIINITLNEYSNKYLDIIKAKLKTLFIISNTKKIIVDETTDILKRVMIITANEMSIKTEFLPHGIIYEDEHIFSIKSLTNKMNVLAWNNNSQKYFYENDIKSTAIQYPISLTKNKHDTKKDLLILISGNRHSLNNYERTIATLQSGLPNNLSIDWKYHQVTNKDEINVMKKQKYDMEKYFNIKINTIHPSVKLTSIIKNYKKLLFTTWTTGIFEAALLGIPFIIYTIEPYKINAFKDIKLPVAQTIEKCTELLMDNNVDYLDKIKESLLIQPKLVDYLRREC